MIQPKGISPNRRALINLQKSLTRKGANNAIKIIWLAGKIRFGNFS